MKSVGTFAAKTHLSELLDRVGRGETITISRHGVAVAVLAPVHPVRRVSHAEVVAGLAALRRRVKPGSLSVREMVQEGRRH
ncbi:MAG TPA: type II toxin-antitoxin system prevent-host-death family antitoxin [Terriglobales bacterium]|nr:type II toxin-antitoxin system prevent-host-death family antitoxin [Terriglobales bacterium]